MDESFVVGLKRDEVLRRRAAVRRTRLIGGAIVQPAAQATLKPSKWVKTAGLYGVPSLDQPVEAIDQALRHFSNGTAAVAR